MVQLLTRDIASHAVSIVRADRERGISLLPRKRAIVVFHGPHRRSLLRLAHDVGQPMRGSEPDQKMHVIGDTARSGGDPAQAADGAAQIHV